MLPPDTRRRARALQLLYAWELQGRPALEECVAGLSHLTGPDASLLDGGDHLALAVTRRLKEIDELIAGAADRWRFERIGLIERILLRIGVGDLLAGELPPRLAIDTTLWLTHRFAPATAVPFVNGVLDRVARQLGRL